MRLRTLSHKLSGLSAIIILFPRQQTQCPILEFFTKVKMTKYKYQRWCEQRAVCAWCVNVASLPRHCPAFCFYQYKICEVNNVHCILLCKEEKVAKHNWTCSLCIHDPLPTPQSKVTVFKSFTCVEKALTKHEKGSTIMWLTLHPSYHSSGLGQTVWKLWMCHQYFHCNDCGATWVTY